MPSNPGAESEHDFRVFLNSSNVIGESSLVLIAVSIVGQLAKKSGSVIFTSSWE